MHQRRAVHKLHRPFFSPASNTPMRLVEIRSYQLKAHTAKAFHQLVSEQSVPLLRQWGTDVVAYGISAHEENGYFLIRAYQDRADLQQSQDQFYASEAWRSGSWQRSKAP